MPPQTSLRAYIQAAKSVLKAYQAPSTSQSPPQASKRQPLTFVVGNESADLDSLTSSLIYAYLHTTTTTPSFANLPSQTPNPSFYIPLTNLHAPDISLRPEFSALISHAGLSPSHLITLDDVPADLAASDTEWILVDHNVMRGELAGKYKDRVVGVVDHHEDEGAPMLEKRVRQIEVCGSCTSLVVESSKGLWDDAATSDGNSNRTDTKSRIQWDGELARLGIGSVLVDTGCLRDEAKARRKDIQAVTYLEEKIRRADTDSTKPDSDTWDRKAFWGMLDHAKRDIHGMKLIDVLRKDYKEWDEGGVVLGVSTVVRDLSYMRDLAVEESSTSTKQKDDTDNRQGDTNDVPPIQPLLDTLASFSSTRTLDIYALMTAYVSSGSGSNADSKTDGGVNDSFHRELVVWGLSDTGAMAARKFARESGAKLELKEMWEEDREGEEVGGGDGQGAFRRAWVQERLDHSRKQVAPLLRGAMR